MGLGDNLGQVGKGATADQLADRIEKNLLFLVHAGPLVSVAFVLNG